MNVLISANRNFVEASKAMLLSLVKNNTWDKINVYLFQSGLNNWEITSLAQIVKEYGNSFYSIKVDDSYFEGIPLGLLSKETYYRLMATMLLDNHIDRILYLDSDMIITGSLKELYNTDMKGYYYAAALDTSKGVTDYKRQLRIPEQYTYINAGVLLMNLNELRGQIDVAKALKFAKDNPRLVPNCDQDVINGLFYDKIKIIDGRFNYEARFHSFYDLCIYPFICIKNKLNPYIAVIHYMGKDKPWKKGYGGKFGLAFYYYARHTRFNKYSFYNLITWPYYAVKTLLKIK